MLQLIPVAVKEVIKITSQFDKEWYKFFFGFIEVEVTCPSNIKIPLLPHKHEGKTIFPRGTWIGVYFSEELYAVMKHGYKVTPLIGGLAISMRGEYIFNEYVKAFYAIKATSKGAQRWIAKMHLNSLYGVFGRKCEINVTSLVKSEDLKSNMVTKLVDRVIPVTDDYSLIRYVNNLDPQIIKQLQVEFDQLQDNYSRVVNNVAIASAVTAYARIHMMQFKVGDIGDSIYYTDTDSIFTDKPLPDHMIGKELGLMKDELDGEVIQRAYFLGIKRYCLVLNDKIKTVFAGVPKNSLTEEDFKELASGNVLKREFPDTFFKSMQDMTITVKPRHTTMSIKNDKSLLNNCYTPLNVEIQVVTDKRISTFVKIKNRFNNPSLPRPKGARAPEKTRFHEKRALFPFFKVVMAGELFTCLEN